MKNQNASAEYPHIPAKGSLQTALCRWRLSGPCRPCSGGKASKAPVWMGEVLFLTLQRFFCGKAAGFPLPPLNAGL